MRWRGQCGQATTEYVALLLLVAVVLAAAAVAVADPGIGRSVLDGLRGGLCAVTGTQCRAKVARQPCVVSRRGRSQSASLNVSVIRIGADAAVIRELRSDGTVAVTLVTGGSAGTDVGVGMTAGGYGGELRLAGIVGLGRGRTWIARDEREADGLIEALGPRKRPIVDQPIALVKQVLGAGDGPKVREPDLVFVEGTSVSKLGLALKAAVKVRYGGALTRAVGVMSDARSGRRTFYMRLDSGGLAALTGRMLGGVGAAEGGQIVVGVTLDAAGEPVEASVSTARAAGLSGELPAAFRKLVGGGGRGEAAARVELEARLDLADPGNAAAIDGFLRALRRPGRPAALGDAAARLGERLAEDARIDARAYRTFSDDRETGGRIRAGGGLGAGLETRDDSAALLGAWERPPGGQWLERADCTEAPPA
jgi:hypothetical protein